MKLARRMSRLGTETAFDVLAKARRLEAQGKHIVHLEIGEPDFDTPKNIVASAKKALDQGWTHYGPSVGLPETRAAIADYIRRSRGVPADPEEVVVVPGGKPIMFYVILALVDEGDEVVYPNPGFPIYESMINFAGGKPIPLPLRERNGFNLDVDELEKLLTPRTRLLILNSPANPTGGVLSAEDIERIARILAKFPACSVLSDEIYSEILYTGTHHSIAALPGMKERTIILDGFSKAFAMTGWRAGYGIAPKALVPHLARLMSNSNSCTASFTQRACLEALTGPQDAVRAMVSEFRRRRDAIVKGLNAVPGFSCRLPEGAFYAFPNVRATGLKSGELSDHLLNEAGVACLSGTCFGAHGEGYLRFSYANSVENIELALERIRKASSRWTNTATRVP